MNKTSGIFALFPAVVAFFGLCYSIIGPFYLLPEAIKEESVLKFALGVGCVLVDLSLIGLLGSILKDSS